MSSLEMTFDILKDSDDVLLQVCRTEAIVDLGMDVSSNFVCYGYWIS
jgi:hypothetical protein